MVASFTLVQGVHGMRKTLFMDNVMRPQAPYNLFYKVNEHAAVTNHPFQLFEKNLSTNCVHSMHALEKWKYCHIAPIQLFTV